MKPIIFNTEMVKAILDGRKTRFTKFIGNRFRITEFLPFNEEEKHKGYRFSILDEKTNSKYDTASLDFFTAYGFSKYKVDDILYVKETFCIGAYANDGGCETNGYSSETYISQCSFDNNIIYYADAIDECDFSDLEKDELPIWKPSVHLKQKDARIFLKVINVRVERLNDIGVIDVIKEGCPKDYFDGKTGTKEQVRDWWINLWNSTAKDCFKWEDNPYVFVYEFKIIEK